MQAFKLSSDKGNSSSLYFKVTVPLTTEQFFTGATEHFIELFMFTWLLLFFCFPQIGEPLSSFTIQSYHHLINDVMNIYCVVLV